MMRLAAGYDGLINLGRGDPDLPTPAHIVEAAKAALDRGETKYTAPAGLPELRTAIAGAIRRRWGVRYDPDTEVLVTDGTQQGIFVSLQCLVNPGDEVLIPEPYYAAYETGVAMAGGVMVRVPTRLEDQFELRPESIRAAITPRTRVLALISPSNPTGGVILPETMAEIARIAETHELVVLSDELYESIVYEGIQVRSFPTFPGMRDRTILLNGFSKAYCMTGLRVGYLAGPAAFLAGMLEPRHTISICTPAVSQRAALAALTGPQEFLTTYLSHYDERRRRMAEGLRSGGIGFGEPRGAFFIFADIRPTGMSSLDFCTQLLRQERVLIFPGNLYGPGGEGFARISYLAPLDQIQEATVRIVRFYKDRLS
jgi:aspartate/methionine/tyrosine aminotransferase